MADTFLKIGTSFPQGAFRPDGQPNIPSQAYADYLAANSMTPRADPVGYVAPSEEQSIFTEYNQDPLSNYGFDYGNESISNAGQSFKNAVTGQGVAQALPEMKFYPGGPTGAEYVYGGVADVGLGAINALMGGLGYGAGFVAEQLPFQKEGSEDRFARDALAGIEFAEQYLTPYFGAIGIFSKLGKASKAATSASKAPEVTTMPKLKIDNPGGDWLKSKLRYAQEAREGARPNTYQSTLGTSEGVTGYFTERLRLDPKTLQNIAGSVGEERYRPDPTKIENLRKSIAETGYEEAPILIQVREDGVPFVVEGNHRIIEGIESGRPSIPVELRYLRGAEDVDGPLSPAALGVLR